MMTLIDFHQPLNTPRVDGSSAYAHELVAELRDLISAILCVLPRLHKANMYSRRHQFLFGLLTFVLLNIDLNTRYSDLL